MVSLLSTLCVARTLIQNQQGFQSSMGLRLIVKMLLVTRQNHWLSVVVIWSLFFCLVQMSNKQGLLSNLPSSSKYPRTLMYMGHKCLIMLHRCHRANQYRLKLEWEAVKALACGEQGQNLTLAAFLPNLNNNKLINFEFNFIFNLINYKSFN